MKNKTGEGMLDLEGVEAERDFIGLFPATITKVEEKISKNGNNYISIEYTVFGDEFKGRKCIESYVLNNDFGKQKLAKVVDMCGLDRKLEITDLLNKQLKIKVSKKPNEEYSKMTSCEKYEAPESQI